MDEASVTADKSILQASTVAPHGKQKGISSPRSPSPSAALSLLPDFVRAMLYESEERRATQARLLIEALEGRNPAVARRLKQLFPQRMAPVPMVPKTLVSFVDPRFDLSGVVMPPHIRADLQALLAEHSRAEELRRFDLHPRNRILLSGPPGNGKTMIAEALAKELGLIFLTASYSGLIDSHLGVTGRNIDELFRYVNAVPCLLFLDEFDAIGAARTEGSDVREFRRVTNQLLVTLDQLSPRSVLVAATNAEDLIDTALKRRFDMPMVIGTPNRELKLECALRELNPAVTPGFDMRDLAIRVADGPAQNLDEVVKLCRKLRRDAVLNGGSGFDEILPLRS